MKLPWKDHLDYFNYGEWDVVNERLKDLELAKKAYCPGRKNLFKALDLVPFDAVKAIIVGQDPYPNPSNATGVAFSIPGGTRSIPPTLAAILNELQSDYPDTRLHGDLTDWCKQGVLLWNAYPSCAAFKSTSHHWPEWHLLTKEIIEKQSARGVVVTLLGATAGAFDKYVDETKSWTLKYAHPSPRGKNLFAGCRMFSTINSKLRMMGESPIDWRLRDEPRQQTNEKDLKEVS